MAALIGVWGHYSREFLCAVIAFTLPVFALPIFLRPLQWARRFGWPIPGDEAGHNLALYFGRCLGAFILIVEGLMVRAVLGTGAEFTFQILIAVAVLMVWVHIVGWREGRQPFSETLEIGMYSGLGLLALLFYPT